MAAASRGTGALVGLGLLVIALSGCTELIGASDPTLRTQDDATAPESCVLNSDCTMSGEICIFRVCSPPCHNDYDCAAGSRCFQTQNGTACVSDVASVCDATHPACPPGSMCQAGACRNECGPSASCLPQQTCVAGGCVGTDPAHDPGLDAGLRDGSLPSSPGPDAAADVEPSEGAANASDAVSEGSNTSDATIGDATGTAPDAERDAPHEATLDAPNDATGDAMAESGCGNAGGDLRNCGACGHDCTALPHVSGQVTCSASGQCVFSAAACAPGWMHCSAVADQGCETDISKVDNCGGCGTRCQSAAPVCSGSGSAYTCVTGCSGSLSTLCNSTCVNTTSDPANCGACSHACPTVTRGQPACSNSVCAIKCNTGYTDCSGACVDLTSDDSNCNACGSKCLGGEHCVGGSCQCTGGTHVCGGTCVANDISACGASCTACVAPSGGTVSCDGTGCVQTCTVAGDVSCSNACVNKSTDSTNCGTCGLACMGATPVCVGGNCVACTSGAQCTAGNTPQSCVNNQWVSQTPCSGTTPVCLGGACVACTTGTQCAGNSLQTCIANQWVTQMMCTSTQVCRTSACVNAVHDVGQDTSLGSTFTLSANYMYFFRLPQLAHDATVLGFGAYGTATTSAHAKMAIYADDGTGTAPAGLPLDWLTTPLTLSSGQIQQTANSTGHLSASTYYWLAIDVDTSTPIYSQASSGVGTGFPQAYVTYPTGMGGSSYSGLDFAIYVNVQDLN